MLGHDDRRVGQFDLLDRVELASQSPLQSIDFVVLDFVVDGFVDALRRQRLAQFCELRIGHSSKLSDSQINIKSSF